MNDHTISDSEPLGVTRRSLLLASSAVAAGAVLGLGRGVLAQTTDFDINAAFAAFYAEIGGAPGDAGGKVTFVGSDPLIHSHFRIGTSMAIPAMAAGLGAAAVWKERTGEEQDVTVDLREAIYAVNPILTPIMQFRRAVGLLPPDDPVAKSFTFTPTINGRLYQAPVGLGNPFSFVPFETRDGRFVNITAVYPHLNARALNLLGASPEVESIRAGVKKWNGEDLEQAIIDTRAVGTLHRTTAEWLAHPEGMALASVPVIDIRKIGDSDPEPWDPNPTAPLSGIKGLALTHVIAGSTAMRTLAEYGAEILQVARDQSFEHEVVWTDVNIGMRSTLLDLTKEDQKEALYSLIPDCDVFAESFAGTGGRGIERLGFGREELAKRRPGIIYLTIRGFSFHENGPWHVRAGFDMEAVSATGYTFAEATGPTPSFGEAFADPLGSGDVLPAFPPTFVLNDYIAGYLGAAGVIAALRRRAAEGGSWHVSISLARAAMWYASLGMFPSKEVDTSKPEHQMIAPATVTGDTAYGRVTRLAPLARLSRTPGQFPEPLLVVRGADLPKWKDG